MTIITTNRNIDARGFPHPAVIRWDGTECTVTAEDVDEATLQAAVDAAPTAPDQTTLDANRATISDRARAALASNRAFIAANKPTTAAAQASAAYDQARALTRQMNGVIRLLLAELDSTD